MIGFGDQNSCHLSSEDHVYIDTEMNYIYLALDEDG